MLLSRAASPSLAVIAVTVKIQLGRMTMIDLGDEKEVVWGCFWEQWTTNSDSAPQEAPHMPIGCWSLWGQQRSVTLGDLSWPWNSHDARSRVTASPILTPIISTIPIQVNRTTLSCVYSLFRWNLAEGCSSYDVITSWPDLTWPNFFAKSCAKDSP